VQLYEEDIRDICDEIIEEKLMEKNRKYGNSVYTEGDGVFNQELGIEELINARLDDKLRRLKVISDESEKYDSELKEIVGYLLLLINYRNHQDKLELVKHHYDEKLQNDMTDAVIAFNGEPIVIAGEDVKKGDHLRASLGGYAVIKADESDILDPYKAQFDARKILTTDELKDIALAGIVVDEPFNNPKVKVKECNSEMNMCTYCGNCLRSD